MPEPKPIVINAPEAGIAPSPMKGNGDVRNLDIFSIPGIVRLNHILVKESGATGVSQITDRTNWIVKNPASPANLYCIDKDGIVYTSADSGDSWTEVSDRGGVGNGLAVWKDYLFVGVGTTIDTYGPLSGTPNWETGWQTIDTNAWQPMLVSKLDGKLYIGGGRYIASVEEVAGQNFADGDSGTYTWTQQALDLPEDYQIKCLAEQNNNLMIGTWIGANIYDNMIADIFPWDGSSTSYNTPIQISERGVNTMINIGGLLYILAGTDGKIYKSNGIQAWPIAQLPTSVVDITAGKFITIYPGAIMQHKGKLFFGISKGSIALDGIGIYSLLETSKGNILNFEHSISTETMSGSTALQVSALLGISNSQFVAAWTDNTTYGIDMLSTTSFLHTTAYIKAYFDSPLLQAGTHLNLRQLTNMEFTLAKELAASEGVQIKFRINLTDSWTTIGTYTTTNIGTGKTSYNTKSDELNIPATKQIQIRVELLGTSTSSPEFRNLILT